MNITVRGTRIVNALASAIGQNHEGVFTHEYDEQWVINVEDTGFDAVTICDDEWLDQVARERGVFLEPINSALIGVHTR